MLKLKDKFGTLFDEKNDVNENIVAMAFFMACFAVFSIGFIIAGALSCFSFYPAISFLEFVKHYAKEYNRDKKDKDGRTAYKINTNSIEGFWSQLKRGIYGVYHWASNKHIQRYINEFCYRYNNRLMNDIEIFANWFGGCENKRVYYKCLVG